MPGWTLLDTHPTQGRIFKRPLDPVETCSYLWRLLNGTSDILHHYEIHLSNGAQDAHLFSETNIVKAWLSTKRRFPLSGAAVCSADGAPLQFKPPAGVQTKHGMNSVPEPHFVVREHDLASLRPGEVTFGSVASAEAAQQQAATVIGGLEPRPLSDEMLAQLHVLRETDAERGDVLHVMILVAHCMTDGTANRTFVRCLLDTLARGDGAEPAQLPLEARLAMEIPLVDLDPAHVRSLSPAIQRWRRAVATVIFHLRAAQRRGGHTLPRRLAHSTPYVVARSKIVSASLTDTQTAAVLASCRQHGITFGSAYIVLAQVAMTRVLYRRYLRGEISEAEWEYRKRQPHISGGPLNLRPYLDKAWFDQGGAGEFMSSITIFHVALPFMTLGPRGGKDDDLRGDGAPPFSDLLTMDRFVYRARLARKQVMGFIRHPLCLEIVHASHRVILYYTQLSALRWMQMQYVDAVDGRDAQGEDEARVLTDMPWVSAHGGASLGNLDLIFPTEYPIPPAHPLSPYSSDRHPVKAGYIQGVPQPPLDSDTDTIPRIVIKYWKVHFHTRPGELYLGAATSQGRMSLYVHYDANVFEEEVVSEWLDEVKGAVSWYLDQS